MAHPQAEFLQSPSVWHPRSAAEAWQMKRSFGADSVFVAGGTLLRTQWESGIATQPAHFINLNALSFLSGIQVDGKGCRIGALTPLAACRSHTALQLRYPQLTEAARVIAAPSIRNLATLGGNVLSRTGDALPALLVLSAELEWQDDTGSFREPLADWLQREQLAPTPPPGILTHIWLPYVAAEDPTRNKARFVAYHKVGRREVFMPSLVTVAIDGSFTPEGRIETLRLAAGGGQTIPYRLADTEAYLEGRLPDDDWLNECLSGVEAEYEPRPDPFASDAYRKQTAANLTAASLWEALQVWRQDREG